VTPSGAIDPALRLTLRAALSLLFFWAAAHKLRDVGEFRKAVTAYKLLPSRGVSAAAALLIATEMGIAAGLLTPRSGTAAALGASGLLCLYAGAIAVNLLRGRRHIDCGCAGAAARRPISTALVARNTILIVAAALSALPATARILNRVDGVTVVGGIIALALLYAAADELIANAGRLAQRAQRGVMRESAEIPYGHADHA
jgi:hypothetical protein